jgi:hypothetical protein
LNPEDTAKRQILEDRKHMLAWVEHRRWNAFTRTMGYQSTDALEKNLASYASHKNMPLKLHPCLVEAKMPVKEESYITGDFASNGKLDAAKTGFGECVHIETAGRYTYYTIKITRA